MLDISAEDSDMKELIGKIVVQAYLSRDKKSLGFELRGGEKLIYHADGDCCSYSWIEQFSNHEYLPGALILDVQKINVPGIESTDDKCIQCYGVKIVLEGRPAFEFEFRNSSNGYYGGSIEIASYDEGIWNGLLTLEDFENLSTCYDVLHS